MAETRQAKVRKVRGESDVYTALLGLALLTLLATLGLMCWSGWQMFGRIFTVVTQSEM
jgi:hypothetical protein